MQIFGVLFSESLNLRASQISDFPVGGIIRPIHPGMSVGGENLTRFGANGLRIEGGHQGESNRS